MKIEDIREKALPILKEAGVTRSALFGSIARGDNTETSDIDILVEIPRGTGLFRFINLQRKLEQELHQKVDLVTYKSIHPRMRENILNEQISLL